MSKPKSESFGERIRRLRAGRFTQQKLADAAGISKTYLWQLETGASLEPSASTLKSLADALGYSMDVLWTGGNATQLAWIELLRKAIEVCCRASPSHLHEIIESAYKNPTVKLRKGGKK